MAETLGSLCDKLTIVKLKQWHSGDPKQQKSLRNQEQQLRDEIDEFIDSAVSGRTPVERLTFAANKVFKRKGNIVADINGSIAEVFSELATVNCNLWHEQEKVYEFEKIPVKEKNAVIKRLALLNLKRNKCIDGINQKFCALIKQQLRQNKRLKKRGR